MAIKIPDGFNVHEISLDPYEQHIRDALGVDMQSWAEFRHSIMAGTDAKYLESTDGSVISDAVKEAYRELGKSHYAVVRSLGWAKVSLRYADGSLVDDLFISEKGQRDFYSYLGRVLDNLARLVYIINVPDSPIKTIKKSPGDVLQRHWIGWGDLVGMKQSSAFAAYKCFLDSERVDAIRNTRHVLTHGWAVPLSLDKTGAVCWPNAIRTERDFLWGLDPEEQEVAQDKYKTWIPVTLMMSGDFAFIETFQSQVFQQLTDDVATFEKNQNVVIRVPPEQPHNDVE